MSRYPIAEMQPWSILAMICVALLGAPYLNKALAQTTSPARDFTPDLQREIVQQAARNVSALKDSRSRAEMHSMIGRVWATWGDKEAARDSFLRAVQAAKEVKQPATRVYTLEDVAVAQIESDVPNMALATIRQALEATDTLPEGFRQNTPRMWIVRTFARAGDVESALASSTDFPSRDVSELVPRPTSWKASPRGTRQR